MSNEILHQIIRNYLIYTAEEMGIALRNSSYSPNIKERMDHSTAVFDSDLNLVAQAEHIPVHLGSMEWGMRKTIDYCRRHGIIGEGEEMVAVNNPYLTGTHLNDLMIVHPVHHKNKIVCYLANKAHHSDVGGDVPGSISLKAETIFDEGYVLEPVTVYKEGRVLKEKLHSFISSSRTPTERKGDIRAQIAANITGKKRIEDIIAKYGVERFREACMIAQQHSRNLIGKRLNNLGSERGSAEDFVEDVDGGEIKIKVSVKVSSTEVSVDYSGSSPQVSSAMNSVFGVTLSGVYFVFMCIFGRDVKVNHGAFSYLAVKAPRGSVMNPSYPRAVGIGNVETSQRNADVLFKAFSGICPELVPAACGGSMNNLMMGGFQREKKWAFYETIGVGMGGRKGIDGIDGVHCNMTNTMNTPIEEIERSFPLIVTCYELREDSCGAGLFRGGCGIRRGFMMLSDTTVTFISDRVKHRPWGLLGGKSGESTCVVLEKQGKRITMPSKFSVKMRKGEKIEINTAGGGGYSSPERRGKDIVISDIENGYISAYFASREFSLFNRLTHNEGNNRNKKEV